MSAHWKIGRATRSVLGRLRVPVAVLLALALLCPAGFVAAQVSGGSSGASSGKPTPQPARVNKAALDEVGARAKQRLESGRGAVYEALLKSTDAAQQQLNADPNLKLMFVAPNGMPVYYKTDNLIAAQTVSSDEAWPGGGTGHNLTGGFTAAGELAIWDGGGVRTTHQEFGGRATQIDAPGGTIAHATHVAGTMIAAGVDGNAKGMSYEGTLHCYDWDFDATEMATAAAASPNMHVSNHSYGYITGWYFSGSWYWFGDLGVSGTEDYGFGYYSSDAATWDDIAQNAPEYLIVRAAGNDRDDAGPVPGGFHYHWSGGWVGANDVHQADGAAGGFDTVEWIGNAKNILLVGAVNDIPGGYVNPAGVVQTAFSSWGPTDDGRIKPDVVANGQSLYSCTNSSDIAYTSMSGTSMASPNTSGSVNLLYRHYEAEKGQWVGGKTPRSSTMKAIVVHTADEAGAADGPDYSNGWGLLNTAKAADLIAAGGTDPMGVGEADLAAANTDYYYFEVTAAQDVRVTIAWTDPEATPPAPALDPPALMLVNDLDLRIERLNAQNGVIATYSPWILNPAVPAGAATTGDNTRDNVEMVDVSNAPVGRYRAKVSHKGVLSGGSQGYGICWSGMVGVQPPYIARGGVLDLGVPGVAPNQVSNNSNQERGIFITAIKDFEVRALGMKLFLPCEATTTVRIYAASGTTRGALLAQSSRTYLQAGETFYYVPILYTLQACQEYDISVEFEVANTWPWWSEFTIDEPYDIGGVIRVRDGEEAGGAGNFALPYLSVIGATVAPEVTVDLDPDQGTGTNSSTNSDQDRGIYIKAEKTVRLCAFGWNADLVTPQVLTARLYEATGTTRGALLAVGVKEILATGLQFHDVPINYVLEEGKEYDLAIEFGATTSWPWWDEGVLPTEPYTKDVIRVVDAEYFGDAGNFALPHYRVLYDDYAGGAPFDLAKHNDVFPPPNSTNFPSAPYGMYIQALNSEEIYSLGWMADVPEGEPIIARIYGASGTTRGSLISEGTIYSRGGGMQFHDVPVSASLLAGADYDIEIQMPANINEWRWWVDDDGNLPYDAYGLFRVVNGESGGDAGNFALLHMRMNGCDALATAVPDDRLEVPRFTMSAPYPNPVSARATIRFTLDEAAPVTMTVYDVAGRRVATLLGGENHPAGPGLVEFDSKGLASGVYFVKMQTPQKSLSRKITIVR